MCTQTLKKLEGTLIVTGLKTFPDEPGQGQ